MGLGNGKLLKINGSGGSGYNMFALCNNAGGFVPLCGTNHFAGCQDFRDSSY